MIEGGIWTSEADNSPVPTFVKYYGGAALGELFQHQPFFRPEDHQGVATQALWASTLARSSRLACQALGLPFELDPSQRQSCADILAHPWVQDRPVFKKLTLEGHYGPTVFLQISVDDECRACEAPLDYYLSVSSGRNPENQEICVLFEKSIRFCLEAYMKHMFSCLRNM